MSRCPFFVEYERPRISTPSSCVRIQDLGLTPQDYFTILAIPELSQEYRRNWRNLRGAANDVGSTIKEDKNKFQINLDVQHFAPEEISVKAADGFLVVDAKHEEKKDEHGFISRSFTRKYAMPENVDVDCLSSKLSSDGVLTVSAPFKTVQVEDERIVPIVQTGPVRKQAQCSEG